ncbi:MAG: DNA topoisomerase [Oscillospiraceae bacterium]|nr:DNA topoisomerase [Oscillospiraceae bacterium]
MKLIVAEKPMLARAIADAIPGKSLRQDGYIQKGNYTIVSAFGHLLTLKEPEDYDEAKYRRWTLDALPIYFENWGQKPGEGKTERLQLIGSLLKEAECVIHAGDPDDEGQYLIDEILRWFDYRGPVWRLSTGDTTEAALAKALTQMKDNQDCVNAGWSAHARSVADIMVGFNFSRYFSLKNPHVKMLTVGRVQTPTLGLVVERDMAIENHAKQSYFTITAELELGGQSLTAVYEPAKDNPRLEDGRLTDEGYVSELVRTLTGVDLSDGQVQRKDIREQPPLPFNLVKLQTYCSARFGYDPSQTLSITQSLRDNHNAITYNRSDCQYLSEEQYKQSPATVSQVLENLQTTPYGKAFSRLPLDTSLHSRAFDDKNISAHTAIIPQNRRLDLSKLTEEERNVYLAITKYFMAQFLAPAEKERTTLEVPAPGGLLKAASTRVLKPGYLVLMKGRDKEADEEEESNLSLLGPGSYGCHCHSAKAEGKETKAPPRYTKASLNEDMTRIARYVKDPKAKALLLAKDKEKKGENGSIGTSATRAAIIDNLELRGYIESKGKQIRSTPLGRELYRILPEELKKPDMTGYWWAIQESIQEGSQPWAALTDSVLEMIQKVVAGDYPRVDAYYVPESMRRGRLILGSCPRCGRDIIEGQNGFGCSGFREGCRFTIWRNSEKGMMSHTEITADMVHELLNSSWIPEEKNGDDGESHPTGRMRTQAVVPCTKLYSEAHKKTYAGMVYLADEGRESPYGASFGLAEILQAPSVPLGSCPRCGRDVIEGKNGYGCSGYKEGCRFVIWKKAKSGMMSQTRITRGVVRTLLKSRWIPETGKDGRRRTETTVHMKKLYSEAKNTTYSGDVFLYDDGSESPYGASFGLAAITNDGPEVLGSCPRCGREVTEAKLGYGCSGYREGCKFSIWKNSKMKLLANVTFTKTDAKKFLAGKTVKKRKLIDKKGRLFTAELMMEEKPENPFGPVFRVVEGTIEAENGDPGDIRIETYPRNEAPRGEGLPSEEAK